MPVQRHSQDEPNHLHRRKAALADRRGPCGLECLLYPLWIELLTNPVERTLIGFRKQRFLAVHAIALLERSRHLDLLSAARPCQVDAHRNPLFWRSLTA